MHLLGYLSWRGTSYGSWYIQALCSEIAKCAKTHELIQIMVRINNTVAKHVPSNTGQPATHGMVQIPSFTCMLRGSLWLVNDHK